MKIEDNKRGRELDSDVQLKITQMRLKVNVIQLMVAELLPSEMAAVHLIGLGQDMPESITKNDLANIIVFLFKQLDWIEIGDQENKGDLFDHGAAKVRGNEADRTRQNIKEEIDEGK